MNKKQYGRMLHLSCVCFAVSAAAFLLIPFGSFHGTNLQRMLAYSVGICFWGGLIGGLWLTSKLSAERKKRQAKPEKLPGLFRFFRNPAAKRIDPVLFAGILLTAILAAKLKTTHVLTIISISIMSFLISLHAVLNGNNYAYYLVEGKEE